MCPTVDEESEDGSAADHLASQLVRRVRAELTTRGAPLLVGLDGRRGTGKSTLATVVADRLVGGHEPVTVTVIEGDQFYAGGSAASWDERTPAQRAALVIDWRRQRSVLEQLRERGVAEWQPFDWEADDWDTDQVPLVPEPVGAVAASVVLVEGAYSCRPELHDLLDLRILLELEEDECRRRILAREGDERPDRVARWSGAEAHYFGNVMPPERFDVGAPLHLVNS